MWYRYFRCGIGIFPLRAFSDTTSEIISNRTEQTTTTYQNMRWTWIWGRSKPLFRIDRWFLHCSTFKRENLQKIMKNYRERFDGFCRSPLAQKMKKKMQKFPFAGKVSTFFGPLSAKSWGKVIETPDDSQTFCSSFVWAAGWMPLSGTVQKIYFLNSSHKLTSNRPI
jgi:hypothetical protein